MQQAAEMALFDTGAKELALAAYDSGESAETATEAYRKARTDGVALVLGPLFGTSAKALAPLVRQGGANVVSFSNDESAAQRGVWIMGIAAPPQVRRVVDYSVEPASSVSPPSRRRRPMASRWCARSKAMLPYGAARLPASSSTIPTAPIS